MKHLVCTAIPRNFHLWRAFPNRALITSAISRHIRLTTSCATSLCIDVDCFGYSSRASTVQQYPYSGKYKICLILRISESFFNNAISFSKLIFWNIVFPIFSVHYFITTIESSRFTVASTLKVLSELLEKNIWRAKITSNTIPDLECTIVIILKLD